MDTEVTLDQHPAPSSATARSAEEFSGHDNAATTGQIRHVPLDDHAKSSDATTDAPSLAERFAGIVYFAARAADWAADGQGERQSTSTHHRTAGRVVPGVEPICSTRGARTPTLPWRLPAVTGSPKN